jgi:electron transfer flavoprotein beta subunit
MDTLVCIKRVPAPGAKIVLTADGQAIDTRHLGFAISPHEECAVEEAVQIAERHGGSVTVLTVGPEAATEQLQQAIAMGADDGVLVEIEATEWDPQATAAAIVDAVRDLESGGASFDLLLFGNESADAANHQVGIRVAHALGLPVVGGAKGIQMDGIQMDGTGIRVRRDVADGAEVYDLPLPAVVGVREGINLPRYPTVMGRMRARKADLRRLTPHHAPGGLRSLGLRHPPHQETETVILGKGAEAAEPLAGVLERLGVL